MVIPSQLYVIKLCPLISLFSSLLFPPHPINLNLLHSIFHIFLLGLCAARRCKYAVTMKK